MAVPTRSSQRFLANEEFNALYETRLAELTEQLITSGDAESVLAGWVELLNTQVSDLVSTDIVESEAAAIRDVLAELEREGTGHGIMGPVTR